MSKLFNDRINDQIGIDRVFTIVDQDDDRKRVLVCIIQVTANQLATNRDSTTR